MMSLRSLPRSVGAFIDRHLFALLLLTSLLLGAAAVLREDMFVTVPAGSQGVVFRPLDGGVELESVYGEGVHVVMPWNRMTLYEMRYQSATVEVEAVTLDQMKVKLGVSVQYAPNEASLAHLHRTTGPDYFDRLIVPNVMAEVRALVGRAPSGEVFSEGLAVLNATLTETVDRTLLERFTPPGLRLFRTMDVKSVAIVRVDYPESVASAMEAKISARVEAETYEFRILVAAKEAERKAVEAEGVRRYQAGVTPGLTENFLRWAGIEATQALAKSENAKIVVFGQGPGGLPLVFDPSQSKSGTEAGGSR